MRCDVRGGLEVSNQLLDLPPGLDPGPARVAGHIALGLANHVRGDQLDARRHFEQAVTLCDAGDDAELARSVTESPAAVARNSSGAIVAWLLGDEDRAEQEADDAFAREAELGMDSWATMVSLWARRRCRCYVVMP